MFHSFKITQNTDNFTLRLSIITSSLLVRDFAIQTVVSDLFLKNYGWEAKLSKVSTKNWEITEVIKVSKHPLQRDNGL